MMMARGVG
jgi:hypothetical protein